MLSRTASRLVGRVAPAVRGFATKPVDFDLYNRQRTELPLGPLVPEVSPDSFLAPNASVIGDVTINDRASLWYGTVVRGDLNSVRIGAYTSLEEKVIVHAARSSPTGLSAATTIGDYVTVGAGSILRSTTIGHGAVVGKKCILMEGSVVEKSAMLEPGTVVAPGRLIPAGQLWGGNPAAFVRALTEAEVDAVQPNAEATWLTAEQHRQQFLPHSFAYIEAQEVRELEGAALPAEELAEMERQQTWHNTGKMALANLAAAHKPSPF